MNHRMDGAVPFRAVHPLARALRVLPLALLAAACARAESSEPAAPPPADAWSAAREIPGWTEALGLMARHRLADVAAGADGRVHVLITTHPPTGRDADGLYHAELDGRAWSRPAPLAAGGGVRMPRVAVDGAGYPHALWYGGAADEGDAPASLLHRARGGAGWSSPETVYRETERGGLDVATLAAARDCDGALQVVHSTAGGLVHRAWTADGWSPPRALRQPALTAEWSAGPCPGGLHLAYMAAGARAGRGVNELFTRALRAAGWDPITHLYGDGTRYAHYPVLLRDGGGTLHAVWLQDTDGSLVPEALYHATSRDGGTWTPGRDITPAELRGGVFWMVRGTVDGAGRPRLALRFSRSARPDDSGAWTLRLEDGAWSAPAVLVPGDQLGEGEVQLVPRGAGVRALWKARDGRYREAEAG